MRAEYLVLCAHHYGFSFINHIHIVFSALKFYVSLITGFDSTISKLYIIINALESFSYVAYRPTHKYYSKGFTYHISWHKLRMLYWRKKPKKQIVCPTLYVVCDSACVYVGYNVMSRYMLIFCVSGTTQYKLHRHKRIS